MGIMFGLAWNTTLVIAALALYPAMFVAGLVLKLFRAPDRVVTTVGAGAIMLSIVLLIVAFALDPSDPSWDNIYVS